MVLLLLRFVAAEFCYGWEGYCLKAVFIASNSYASLHLQPHIGNLKMLKEARERNRC